MADKRAFAKFDIGYFDNPKILEVLDVSGVAVLMHAASILYCAQHLTDGVATAKMFERKLGGSREDTEILMSVGLWHESGHDCESCGDVPDGKIFVHDFLEHNRSSQEAKRASDAARVGARALHSKRHADRSAKGSANRSADRMQTANEPHADRMPRERERDITSSSPAMPSMEFNSFWDAYPKKVGKQAALKAYSKALEVTDAQKILDGIQKIDTSDPKYVPHPATWLNAGRWDDEVIKPKETYSPWDQMGVHK